MHRVLILLIVLSTVLTACNRGADDTTTTTAAEPDQPVTRTTEPAETVPTDDDPAETSAPADDDGDVTAVPEELPGYTIVRREGAEGGDRLVVLLEDYEYTDLVLENLVFEITEEYAPVLEAYLIDDDAASDLVLLDPETLTEDDRADVLASTPLARTGEPKDIARTVLFLTRDAPYVTGQNLSVDGGRSLGFR